MIWFVVVIAAFDLVMSFLWILKVNKEAASLWARINYFDDSLTYAINRLEDTESLAEIVDRLGVIKEAFSAQNES